MEKYENFQNKNEQLPENSVLFLNENQYKKIRKELVDKILKVTHFSKTWDKDSDNELLFSQIAIPSLGESSYEIWFVQNNSPINNKMRVMSNFLNQKKKHLLE